MAGVQSPTPTGGPRLTLARQALAANPGAKNADRIEALQAQTEKTYARAVWNLILKSARERPEERPCARHTLRAVSPAW
ncbi:hypothetical protein [Streptomyces sp. MA5143a]|uniref:hypothetical protein n=1 Tax=Streptomyces sp. MA5143a TaxID=2083010 RepID=UPI000D2884A0|nr:hypothetical protein [Streptomyces sp. MA5143a]SPE99938.1 hypothetical protein SMA5143A_0647 [Streptomyces sp. MA5143a]